MTREEEIIKQVEIYTGDASNFIEWSDGWEDYNDYEYVKKAFIKGAKWADETIIEKACEWLQTNIDNYSRVVINVCSKPIIELTEDFENSFKQAMFK